MRVFLKLTPVVFLLTMCLAASAAADETGQNFAFILQSNENLEISGAASIMGDTYSRGNTQVFGSAAIDGRGYASGSVSFDSPAMSAPGNSSRLGCLLV